MAESRPYYDPELIARLMRIGFRAGRVVDGSISGLHQSPMHGVSPEFADYRQYVPGDDLKGLDWRAFARSDRFYIKRYEEESNLTATILLDASASMSYGQGENAKFLIACKTGVALAAALIAQRDAVGLCIFDAAVRSVLEPTAKQTQLAKILNTLDAAQPGGETELGGVLEQVADKLKRRGLVILLSDLLSDIDALYQALGRLQHAGHEIMLIQILHDDELNLPFNSAVLFHDIEGDEELFAEPWAFRKAYQQAMKSFVDDIAERCRFCGFDHLLLKSGDDIAGVLSHHLNRRQQQAPARYRGQMTAYAADAANPQEPRR